MKKNYIVPATLSLMTCIGLSVGNVLALDVDSDQSRESVVSTKILADGTSSFAEVFAFNALAGTVADDGTATVSIDLGAVETGIDIRNERMGEYLFETATYPEATITATVPDEAMANGYRTIDLDITVDMHGSQMDYTVPVMITSDDEKVLVVASQPLLVDANSFELQGGLGKLGELAGLLHIPTQVPVTFNLSFSR